MPMYINFINVLYTHVSYFDCSQGMKYTASNNLDVTFLPGTRHLSMEQRETCCILTFASQFIRLPPHCRVLIQPCAST